MGKRSMNKSIGESTTKSTDDVEKEDIVDFTAGNLNCQSEIMLEEPEDNESNLDDDSLHDKEV